MTDNFLEKRVDLSEYEYDRLSFLISIIDNHSDLKYINQNKQFLYSLESKFKNKLSHSNSNMFPNSYDWKQKNSEFFLNFKNFYKNFNNIYNYYKPKPEEKVNWIKDPKNQNLDYLPKKMLEDTYFVFLPLSRYLYRSSYLLGAGSKETPLICGLQAHQGCGKTTMTDVLKYFLKNIFEINAETISIDDLYLNHDDLSNLTKSDPRYEFRGPPGTHDINLSLDILDKVKKFKTNFEMPRYDKSAYGGLGDRMKNGSLVSKPVDVLLFEGWFLGAYPENDNPSFDDFQLKISKKLEDYLPIFDQIQLWLVMKPIKYEYSREWRAQAEKNNKQGLSNQQIQNFLNYFWYTMPPYVYFPKLESKRNPIIITLDKSRYYYI